MELIVLVVFFGLTLISVPVGVSLFLAAFCGFVWFTDIPLMMIGQAMFLKLDKFSLLCVLFFVLAGNLMTSGVIAKKIVEFAEALVGHFKAGMAIAAIVSCALFGAVSGSALATLAAIGGLMVPALRKQGASENFSVGLLTSSSILGIIVPPSIPMILYCLVTDNSIARMFLSGFIPAIFIVFALCLYAIYTARRDGTISETTYSTRTLWESFKSGIWGLLMPLIIFGGIFSGVFTATEAAVIAAVYAYFVELCIYRKLSPREICRITIDSGVTIGVLLIITAGSLLMSEFLTYMQIPNQITEWTVATLNNKLFFLLVVNVMLLVLGTFIEIIAGILIMAPILYPVAIAMGVDPIHFGLILILNLGVGYITPPIGVNCFLAASMFDRPLSKVFRAVLPTLLIMFLSILILTYIPTLTTFFPEMIMGPIK
ncbi:C4-dicarboxylate ABC transporter permease [Desulfosarcina widdelii]|uniref:C4-dicarboxylate ABC transporter permease n=1 Tax=Desulfosarcina widdelii TaxID=947919 RepID=A0A5K7Z5E5_9BACT|nr:TRAP transporter large permease [Desulfosarcina widdelii]BBO75940.1 C4-dicarboxylate ABC transporter permease [Desulfosarcina widdelii]